MCSQGEGVRLERLYADRRGGSLGLYGLALQQKAVLVRATVFGKEASFRLLTYAPFPAAEHPITSQIQVGRALQFECESDSAWGKINGLQNGQWAEVFYRRTGPVS